MREEPYTCTLTGDGRISGDVIDLCTICERVAVNTMGVLDIGRSDARPVLICRKCWRDH